MKNKRKRERRYSKLSLSHKLRYIIISLVVPLLGCIAILMCFMGWYARRSLTITSNVNISSRFSLDFKEEMDLKMYHYAVGSKEQQVLPSEDVESAIRMAERLEETTERKESRQAICNVIDYCETLKKRMVTLSETDKYDSRMTQLDNNIYVLTNLIQGKMMDYIYYEAGYLSKIQDQMVQDMVRVIMAMTIIVTLLVIFSLNRSFHFTEGITTPVSKLCDNVNKVGQGDFHIESVDSKDIEIAQLNEGIQQMAKKIELLLENVKEEEKLQHKTQLQLLQAQINPHFLYNTLDTIVWMVEAGMHDEAIEMLTNLSVFFRTALSKGEDIISLEEEMRHTKSYLDIQQVRYRDILSYEIDLPESMKTIRLPKLTLQPLVENALYHGIKEKRGQGVIKISCIDQGQQICIMVEDNGVGMTAEELNRIRGSLEGKGKIGFGLAAVQGRLKLYFGEAYGIHIASEYGKGVKTSVLVPRNIQQNK